MPTDLKPRKKNGEPIWVVLVLCVLTFIVCEFMLLSPLEGVKEIPRNLEEAKNLFWVGQIYGLAAGFALAILIYQIYKHMGRN